MIIAFLIHSGETIDNIKKILTNDIVIFMNWFKQNSLKHNPINFQAMLISTHGYDVEGMMMNDDNTIVISMERMKVIRVKIDGKLNFTEHISDVCIKAGRQLNILQCLEKILDYKSRMAIYKSFVMSNFNYCRIGWVFTSKKTLDRIGNIQKHTLSWTITNELTMIC